ncbi:ADP-ribosylation factor-related protein 1-like isoform X2 [Salvia divinorum]|uniref:ADP-ribosylation factor-related protein 1-like isoform X2 n=1 Tax=Salvia divinorum TaxID=28513 RepID=A0ABD1IDH7_SALDI
MFSLFYGLWKYMFTKMEFHVLILGIGKAGKTVLRHEDLQGAPLLILANKQDREGAVPADELARYLDLKKLNERVYAFQAVSATDGLGIKESVNWLVDAMDRSEGTDTLRVRAGSSVV